MPAPIHIPAYPDRHAAVLVRLSASNADLVGWSDGQLAVITAPTLLIGDWDFTTVEHGALMLELISSFQLSVLPDTAHMQTPWRIDVLVPFRARFLD